MKVDQVRVLGDAILFSQKPHKDERGFLVETWSTAMFDPGTPFVQENLVFSETFRTWRGMHLQHPYGQGKLVQVLHGQIADVIVDVRVGSPSFGKHAVMVLSAVMTNGGHHEQFWVPPGFAHGYLTLTGESLVSYKLTEAYHPETALELAWNDPHWVEIFGDRYGAGISCRVCGSHPQLPEPVVMSEKDRQGRLLDDVMDRLPRYGD